MTDLTTAALKDVLHEVAADEAAAIGTLCAVLEHVDESRDLRCLPGLRKVLNEWQNRPPGAIVTDLMKIRNEMECPTPDNT